MAADSFMVMMLLGWLLEVNRNVCLPGLYSKIQSYHFLGLLENKFLLKLHAEISSTNSLNLSIGSFQLVQTCLVYIRRGRLRKGVCCVSIEIIFIFRWWSLMALIVGHGKFRLQRPLCFPFAFGAESDQEKKGTEEVHDEFSS